MIGGLVGIQGGRLFKGHQFRMHAGRLKSEVRMLKLLAASLDTDISLIFKFNEGHLALSLQTDEKMPYVFKPLKMEVDACFFDERELEEEIILYSRGRQAPHTLEVVLGSDRLSIGL